MAVSVWVSWLVILVVVVVVFGRATMAEPVRVSASSVCPVKSVVDSLIGFQYLSCSLNVDESFHHANSAAATEGDEVSLQKMLTLIHKNSHGYVAVLFYASWCPFSGAFRPTFSILSALYPTIPHLAIEKSVIRPSILSKYGVHGFPTLFVLNSTMRIRYHGSRNLDSLVAFYKDVTGLKTASLDRTSRQRIGHSLDHENHNNEPESCPFSWARSPENLLRQETYLALATVFVLLRLLHFIFPTISVCTPLVWRRYILNIRLKSLLEHPLASLNRTMHLFDYLKNPGREAIYSRGQCMPRHVLQNR